MAKKRGRPAQNRPLIDQGTDEIQVKRTALLKEGKKKDGYLTESLLGVFYAYDLISQSLYEVGCFFGNLGYRYESCLGYSFRPRSSALIWNRKGIPTECDIQDALKIKAWRKAIDALKKAGHHPYQTVLKVVFYDEDLYLKGVPTGLLKESSFLRQGLECLEIYFKGELKDKRDTLFDQVLDHSKATMSQRSLKEFRPFPLS